MIDFIIAVVAGLVAGTFTGLIPGIHINLVAAVLLSLISFIPGSPLVLAIFIIVMSITHTFIDFIPSVYLGAPEDDTFLSVLPGHALLMQGKGHSAVLYTLIGSIIAVALILAITPLLMIVLPTLYELTRNILPFILICIALFLTFQEKNPLLAGTVFLLAGVLGFTALNIPLEEPLLPLLSGLFGASGLLISITQKPALPEQTIPSLREIIPSKKSLLKTTLGTLLTAPLCTFLPGIGAGHAAILAPQDNSDQSSFLMLVGAINTVVMGVSFITLYILNRTRTGSAVAVQELLGELTLSNVVFFLIIIFITGIAASFIAINLSKIAAKKIASVPYTALSIGILIFVSVIVIWLSKGLGLLMYITATALGIFTIQSGTRRINLMGALLFSTILYYL